MINRSQLKFHESFQPEVGYISKILELACANYRGNKFEISEETGIPTGNQKGKVEPHIKYAAYMGLVSYEYEKKIYNLKLTDLGKEVYEQDPYLHEDLSKWLCHYGISRKNMGAPQWAFMINDVHTGFIQGITFDRLLYHSSNVFEGNITFEEAFGVMKRSYLEGFFSSLEYLYINEEKREIHFAEIPEREELLFVYAYALISNWDAILPEKQEITLLELNENLSFGKIFGLNDDSIGEVLDELADERILSVNRQLFPSTIIRTSNVEELIPRLYSRLM